MPARWTLVTAVAVSLAAVSCTSSRTRYTLQVAVAPDANDRTPVPVDIVFVWDKASLGKVSALTASDWFVHKPQFRKDDPQQKSFTICEWEWVPGQVVPEINLAVPAAARRWAYGVFVFAKYRTAGSHRSSLSAGTASLLELRRDDALLHRTGKSSAADYAWIDDRCPAAPPATRTQP